MKKDFKNYTRQYERVFTGRELIDKKCKIDDVSIFDNLYNTDEYITKMKDLTRTFDLTIFDTLVKYSWLVSKFTYRGFTKKMFGSSGCTVERSFGVFMRAIVGYDNRMITFTNNWFGKIITYMEDFFPGFKTGNPFEDSYKYPFKYINLGCLFLVSEMEERMDLLKYGEEKKMSYAEFSDYVLNYINCYNEEYKEDYFTFVFSNRVAPYIKVKKILKKNGRR
jgi:hypothetical protein